MCKKNNLAYKYKFRELKSGCKKSVVLRMIINVHFRKICKRLVQMAIP